MLCESCGRTLDENTYCTDDCEDTSTPPNHDPNDTDDDLIDYESELN
jgi:hypothetical protein